ncbi:MAG: tyrosine-type recombinase/integrase [Methylococcales bacterium]
MKEQPLPSKERPKSRTDITVHEPQTLTMVDKQLKHQRYLQAATSENTRKTYRSAVMHFERWGGYLPTDKETLIRYLLDHADSLNPRTLDVRLTALSQWHQYQGFNDPCKNPEITKTMKGIRRIHGKPKRKAKALRLEHLATMLEHLNKLPKSNKKLRDLAIVQIGYFGAFRRSELVNIGIEDLSWEPEGLIINLPKSKTDQNGEGLTRAIPFGPEKICPVKSIKKWIIHSGIETGPVFRPINRWDQIKDKALIPSAINDLLKSLGSECKFDFVPDISSHSFRRGMTTSASREGVDFKSIKNQGGWKSDAIVSEYVDEGKMFENNAASTLLNKMNTLLS